jgi:hypothetical protein
MKQESLSQNFIWLDAHLLEVFESPDEAVDVIFMLTESDWEQLEAAWEQRPSKWREALAYLLGEGPITKGQLLLRRALFDTDSKVADEAARSFCEHCTRSIEEENDETVEIDPEIIARLKAIVEQNPEENWEDVTDLLASL